jgi:hypothetical protein
MPADLREVLSDIVKQTNTLFEVVKVSGTSDATKLQAVDPDKTLFLIGELSESEPDFEGEFGLSSLGMLNGFLNHASFRADGAEIAPERLPRGKGGTVTLANIAFKDPSGEGATYRAMSAELVGEQPTVRQMPWDITISPQKAKVAEFSQLASLLSDVDKNFTVQTRKTKNGIDLIFGIGSVGSSSHSATMVFEPEVDAKNEVKQPLIFNTKQFLDVMKAAGNNATTLHVFHKGVLGLTVETGRGTYHYFLRAKA